MNTVAGPSPWWATVVIVVVPLVIIAAAELDERLRQRESPLRRAVDILRNWMLPAFAVWAIAVPVVGLDNDSLIPTVAASFLLVSTTAVVLVVLKLVVGGIGERRREEERPVPQLLLAAPRIAVVLVAGWTLVGSVWGVDLSSALAALGVTSLIISFALQDTLSGLASGMLLLSDPPFQTGDWINADEIEGKVLDINWRTTRIQNRDGDTIIVPNSQLANASIQNYAQAAGAHKVRVDLQLAFVNPPTLAKAMLLDAARNTPGVLEEPAPYVAVLQIDDPLMGYQVHMWIADFAIEPVVRTDFGSLVWYQSHRHGVPLPNPAQDLFLYDGVAAGEARLPTPAELRAVLAKSQLLVSLGDVDLDRLAHSSRMERFSVGEVMVDTRSSSQDLLLIAEGRAVLNLVEDDGTETGVAELSVGDTVGLLGDAPGEGRHLSSLALSDCVVLVVEAAVSAEIGSRNAEVAAAFNRTVTLRRRRVERMLERRHYEQAGNDE
ncbi:MAG: mechanosensitive ion channel [Ilumatobacter sp.]|nr:mechanosensitive ion channel [Ilumatobacter sp.]